MDTPIAAAAALAAVAPAAPVPVPAPSTPRTIPALAALHEFLEAQASASAAASAAEPARLKMEQAIAALRAEYAPVQDAVAVSAATAEKKLQIVARGVAKHGRFASGGKLIELVDGKLLIEDLADGSTLNFDLDEEESTPTTPPIATAPPMSPDPIPSVVPATPPPPAIPSAR